MKVKIIAVVGPTATGKTELGVELARYYGGEVISADSMQIYKNLDIASAKPTAAEMKGVPHHLIDIIDPNESFSAADYVRLAREKIAEVDARGKIPIIVGGTGLYISSLLENIKFAEIKTDLSLRKKLFDEAGNSGKTALFERLKTIDPETAETLHENNLPRVIRALEVHTLTGRRLSDLKRESREGENPYDVTYIGLTFSDRQKLYDRINRRVDMMIEQGLEAECRRIFEGGASPTCAQAIGYKELLPYFRGEADFADCAETIKRETRRYSKRQITWFKRNAEIHRFARDNFSEIAEILQACVKILDIKT